MALLACLSIFRLWTKLYNTINWRVKDRVRVTGWVWDLYCHFLFILPFAAFFIISHKHISFTRFLGSPFHLSFRYFSLMLLCFCYLFVVTCNRVSVLSFGANNTADWWESSYTHTHKTGFFWSIAAEIYVDCSNSFFPVILVKGREMAIRFASCRSFMIYFIAHIAFNLLFVLLFCPAPYPACSAQLL